MNRLGNYSFLKRKTMKKMADEMGAPLFWAATSFGFRLWNHEF
jgi:hypothetical protein